MDTLLDGTFGGFERYSSPYYDLRAQYDIPPTIGALSVHRQISCLSSSRTILGCWTQNGNGGVCRQNVHIVGQMCPHSLIVYTLPAPIYSRVIYARIAGISVWYACVRTLLHFMYILLSPAIDMFSACPFASY
jgi:hypothetical protein